MEEGIGYYFKIISDKIKVSADAELKSHGLTLTQSRVLAFINHKGGQAGQKEIEEYLQVSHPTVAGLVSRMEQKGFLVACQDPNDRRTNIVKLTEKAMSVVQEIEAGVRSQDEKLLRSLTDEQIADLRKTLKIIIKDME